MRPFIPVLVPCDRHMERAFILTSDRKNQSFVRYSVYHPLSTVHHSFTN
jgi:hypothetical protein